MPCRGSKSEVTDQRSAIRSLQPNFAHCFGGEDFANVETFRRYVAAFVDWPDDLVDDRLGPFAQFVERGRVRILDHDDDIEVAVAGVAAAENFIIENDLPVFLFVVDRSKRSSHRFEILVAQARFRFHKREDPDRTLNIRRFAAALAPACGWHWGRLRRCRSGRG